MFWNKKKNDEPQQDGVWGPLLAKYPPAKEMTKPSEHIIGACRNAGVPEELLAFMQKYGFGNLGNGILKTIDPEDYFDSLFTWFGGEDYSKIPFMMTGFGDLFYYRKLEGGEYDISLLDIHYRSVSVPAWTVADFVKFLLDPETEEKLLRGKLFHREDRFLEKIQIRDLIFLRIICNLLLPLVIPVRVQRRCLDQKKLNAALLTERAHLVEIFPADIGKPIIHKRSSDRNILRRLHIRPEIIPA